MCCSARLIWNLKDIFLGFVRIKRDPRVCTSNLHRKILKLADHLQVSLQKIRTEQTWDSNAWVLSLGVVPTLILLTIFLKHLCDETLIKVKTPQKGDVTPVLDTEIHSLAWWRSDLVRWRLEFWQWLTWDVEVFKSELFSKHPIRKPYPTQAHTKSPGFQVLGIQINCPSVLLSARDCLEQANQKLKKNPWDN